MKPVARQLFSVIREKDGVHFELDRCYVADSKTSVGDVNLVSHAHFDHLHRGNGEVICSDETFRLAEARTGDDIQRTEDHDVELIPSGHIIGSRASLFGGEERYLYTGDVSLRDRAYIEGFSPPDADILVVESTYGIPAYRLPEQEELEKRILDWMEDAEGPLFLFGYSLGKAQKIQYLVQQNTERRIVAHGAVKKMNDAVEEATDLSFRAEPYDSDVELGRDSVFIGPPKAARQDWVDERVERTGGSKAGFSGWAVHSDDSDRFDRYFPFSDHCGFDDLVELVRTVDPDRVYTMHGFDEAFASHLSREFGYSARPLKKNQSSLEDF